MEVFMTGAATVDITPSRSMVNYNNTEYEPGPEGTPLYANIIYCSRGDEEIVFISADLSFVDRTLVLRIRDHCHYRLGIKPEAILISATHTHNAPTVCPTFITGGTPDPLYLELLISRIVKGIEIARENRQPTKVGALEFKVPGKVGNRRRLKSDGSIRIVDSSEQWAENLPAEGPIDETVGLLAFINLENSYLALIINPAFHNNCCDSFGGGYYHSDIYGLIGNHLKRAFPSLQSVAVIPAPSGNLLPKPDTEKICPGRQEPAAEIGSYYAEKIKAALGKLAIKNNPELKFISEVIEIEDRPLEESTFCEDGCRGDGPWELEFARLRYDPEKKALEQMEIGNCLVEICTIQVGHASIVTNPAELFCEFGLEIRQKSSYPATLIFELTNGYCGYVPTEEAFSRGGYETHRTIYTSRLSKKAGLLIKEKSLELLAALRKEEIKAKPEGGAISSDE